MAGMKTKTLAALATVLFLAVAAFAQGAPDCQFSSTFTSATTGTAIQNTSTPCVAWRVTYFAVGMTALSIQIEGGATSTGPWNAIASGAILQGSNPLTDPDSATLVVNGTVYYPWIRLNVTVFTPTGATGTITARTYGYKGTSAAMFSGSGVVFNPMTTLGDMIYGAASGFPTRQPGNTTTTQKFLSQTGDGVNSAQPSWQTLPANGSLTYYLQNSILASGTYTSGGSVTGSSGQTCVVNTFNGGGTGAAATVALTGSNVIAGGTALVVTAAGTQYTSAPTTAVLHNGTATCSGAIVVATVLNVPATNVTGYFAQLQAPYSPKTTLAYAALATGTDTLQNWITSPGIPNLTFIPAGEYSCHLHALRTGGGTVTLQCLFVETDAAGADIAVIGTSEASTALGTTEAEYRLFFADGNTYTLANSASRIVTRVQAIVSGSAPTVDLFAGGTADAYTSLPSSTVDATNFVPYTGATNDLYLGSHSLLTNAEYSNGTCTTAKTIDPPNGNRQNVTLTNAQTCALTFTQPTSGTVSIQLKVIQSSSGSFNGLISGGKWPGGTIPTITATSGAVDILSCYLDGANAYCVATQDLR